MFLLVGPLFDNKRARWELVGFWEDSAGKKGKGRGAGHGVVVAVQGEGWGLRGCDD